jgi:hypothetical protein
MVIQVRNHHWSRGCPGFHQWKSSAARVEVKSPNAAPARSPAPARDPAEQELYVLRAPSGDASE